MFVFTESDAGRFLIISQIKNTGFMGFAHFRSLELESSQFRLGKIVSTPEVFQHVIRLVLPTLHDQPCRWFRYEREGDQKQSGHHGTQYRNDMQTIGESCKHCACAYQFGKVIVQLYNSISILPSYLWMKSRESQNYLMWFFIDKSLSLSNSLHYWIFNVIDANVT